MIPHSFSLFSLEERAFPEAAVVEKRAVRRYMRQKRVGLDIRAARLKNRRIHERILSLEELNRVNCIALYASMPDEISTDGLAESLLQSGKILAYPRVEGRELQFSRVSSLEEDLACRGSFGIREPDPARCELVPIESIDLFIVPGLAFDPFGNRIGFGAGYYDRLLNQKRPDARSVAVAFEFQVVHAIRPAEHDCPVDWIVTEDSLYQSAISTVRCPGEDDTRAWARHLLQNGLDSDSTLALHADLGVGKTVFVQGLADALGKEKEIISPTFIYCREYEGRIPLIHVDAYRLDRISKDDEPFWAEIVDREGLRVIEWAERLGERLPKSAIHIFGRIQENNVREWTLFTPLRNQLRLHGEAGWK